LQRNPDTQVLIASAGPTGLVLATAAPARPGHTHPGRGRRTRQDVTRLGVQARTLEFYCQIGVADEVVARGLEFGAATLWIRGRRTVRAAFDEMDRGLSPVLYADLPTGPHGQLLVEHLAAGGSVRPTEPTFVDHT
jgi:2-polyprenyl-6-methoxyphenol hydroxylase-like FAD-dependent oxidoreductase